ncbi:F0F1 ATP synthase subunit B [Rhizorhapis sp. SPR117]|uniref:F0F1 ATP synthase subunit B family protein n=1 Tax=Rhizorhapis sp. SPR117 TaxID=2912611 RepID=UPI001F35E255|nr:F0F1 ATP synthase subunit B [Rhizorhapis sp. SPR117]
MPHAGTQAPGGAEHHADPSALGLDATAWVSLAMVIFLGILLWKKVPAAIGGSLDKRIAAIRAQLDEAQQLRAEAEALKAEYEAKMSAAAKEADDMRVRAEEEAEHILVKAKEDASNLVLRRKKMAEDKIAAAERTAIADVRAKVAKAASTAAATLIAEHHDAAADKALVDGTIKGLSGLN